MTDNLDQGREMSSAAPEKTLPELTRRDFVKSAGSVAAFASLGGVLAACTSEGASDTSAVVSSTAAGATTVVPQGSTPGLTGQRRKVVWASHFFFGQPVALGIPVGFRDFLDPLGWEFEFLAPQTDGDVQQTIDGHRQAINLEPDVIVATMQDETSFNESLQAIQDAGIYLMLNNTQPASGNPFGAPFVGQDFVASGRVSAVPVLDALASAGRSDGAILVGFCCGGAGAVGQRVQGQKEAIEAYNEDNGTSFAIEELLESSESDPTGAVSTWTAKYREMGDDLAGVLINQVGDPAIVAAQELGLSPGDVPIGTFDVTPDRLGLLEEGWLVGVMDQQPYAQGYMAAAQAWMYLEGGTQPVAFYDSGSASVTAEGLDIVRAREDYIARRAQELDYRI